MAYVLIGAGSLLGLVFLLSAAGKLRNRRSYAEFVAATGRLSPWPAATATTRLLAAAVVAAELAVLPLLLTPVTAWAGFAVATALLIAFTGAIGLALRRGERTPCRCFGSSSRQPLGSAQVVRNLVLLSVCAFGLVGGQLPAPPPHPAGVLLAVGAGALAATVVVVLDDVVALFRPA
jgi:hypothetical protein